MLKLTTLYGTEVYIDTDNHWFMRVPVEENPDPMMNVEYPPNERINYQAMMPKEPIVGMYVWLYTSFSQYYRTGEIASIEKDTK